VCMGTACYVKGAEKVAARLMDELGIRFGETSKDGVFSLESTRCVGTCGLAPVIMVGDEVHGPLAPGQVSGLLDRYLQKAQAETLEEASV
jgi:NADH:ubiquinone oxidoreductase subunit E